MKKVFAVLLALVLTCGCLAGCGSLSNNPVAFDSISVTLQDGKTLEIDMNQDTIRKVMVDDPYNTIDLDTTVYDEWPVDYGLYVSYRTNGKVDSISVFGSDSNEFSTNFGVSYGDSVAKLKYELGDPAEINEDKTDYYYYFHREGGQFRFIREPLEIFFDRSPDISSIYYVNFGVEDDKVISFHAYDSSLLQSTTSDSSASNTSSEISSPSSEASSSDVPSSQESPQTTEQALLDQNGIKITFTGLEEDMFGTNIKLRIENNTEMPITVQQRDMSVNGIMIDGIFSCDVAVGKIANDEISIFLSDLEENGIDQIENVELRFHIYDDDTWDTVLDSEIISFNV